MHVQADSWRATAAYLYTLWIPRSDLAWEYLRRNARYQWCWSQRRTNCPAAAAQWGLARFCDPCLPAPYANPPWLLSQDNQPVSLTSKEAVDPTYRLRFWRIAGAKSLVHSRNGLVLDVRRADTVTNIELPADFGDDAAAAFVVPVGDRFVAGWAAAVAANAVLTGAMNTRPATRRVTRDQVIHLRALQAFDARTAGAPHRDVAIALFGSQRVSRDWHSDSDVRALTRRSVQRASRLVQGGYRAMIAKRPGTKWSA